MTTAVRSTLGVLAALALAISIVVGSGPAPTRAADPLPLPTIDLGTPLPTIDLGLSPGPSGSTPPASPSARSEGASPHASEAPLDVPGRSGGGRPSTAGDSDSRSGDEPAAGGADRPRLRDVPPLAPTLPDVGSWLVPALGAAVPALIVALLVALQLAGGAAGLGLARAALERLATAAPPWIRR
ncbi:MAG: hypothetical protein ACRDGV_05395 [Candidatus Limnocylindria bacterium]